MTKKVVMDDYPGEKEKGSLAFGDDDVHKNLDAATTCQTAERVLRYSDCVCLGEC